VRADPDFTLPPCEVHVWRVLALAAPWDEAVPFLAPDEALRARRFRVDEAARRFAWTRAYTRIVLGRYLSREPRALTIVTAERGKPHLDDGALEWSVSHSGALGLIAVSRAPVGVDVERLHAIEPRLAARTLSASERLCFGEAPSSATFLGCWTRKEAFLKGTGEGLHRPLREVSILPAGPGTYEVAGEPAWRVLDLVPDEAHAGALATVIASAVVSLYDVSGMETARSTR
jgi:4'-phosphopantetheinyl transferase